MLQPTTTPESKQLELLVSAHNLRDQARAIKTRVESATQTQSNHKVATRGNRRECGRQWNRWKRECKGMRTRVEVILSLLPPRAGGKNSELETKTERAPPALLDPLQSVYDEALTKLAIVEQGAPDLSTPAVSSRIVDDHESYGGGNDAASATSASQEATHNRSTPPNRNPFRIERRPPIRTPSAEDVELILSLLREVSSEASTTNPTPLPTSAITENASENGVYELEEGYYEEEDEARRHHLSSGYGIHTNGGHGGATDAAASPGLKSLYEAALGESGALVDADSHDDSNDGRRGAPNYARSKSKFKTQIRQPRVRVGYRDEDEDAVSTDNDKDSDSDYVDAPPLLHRSAGGSTLALNRNRKTKAALRSCCPSKARGAKTSLHRLGLRASMSVSSMRATTSSPSLQIQSGSTHRPPPTPEPTIDTDSGSEYHNDDESGHSESSSLTEESESESEVKVDAVIARSMTRMTTMPPLRRNADGWIWIPRPRKPLSTVAGRQGRDEESLSELSSLTDESGSDSESEYEDDAASASAPKRRRVTSGSKKASVAVRQGKAAKTSSVRKQKSKNQDKNDESYSEPGNEARNLPPLLRPHDPPAPAAASAVASPRGGAGAMPGVRGEDAAAVVEKAFAWGGKVGPRCRGGGGGGEEEGLGGGGCGE
ncbi:hypothetical protein R3P38DRAFT_2766633 [Favolaschia claudopus]|uniref:Uncharacterized protein n=1 Tax=Favolaschia claudopus TaxID=2862362 RepID=A0AAW0D5C0_9AGAR